MIRATWTEMSKSEQMEVLESDVSHLRVACSKAMKRSDYRAWRYYQWLLDDCQRDIQRLKGW